MNTELGTLTGDDRTTLSKNVGPGLILAIAALFIAFNIALAPVVKVLALPVYLDAIGTIAIALMAGSLGFRGVLLASVVGALSFAIGGLLFNPALFYFIPTQIAIAFYSFYVARPLVGRYLDAQMPISLRGGAIVIGVGIGLGVVAGIVSAPIISFVFGGFTGSGASVVVALLLNAGLTLFKSVLYSGLASEPIDKTIQLIVAIAMGRALLSRINSARVG